MTATTLKIDSGVDTRKLSSSFLKGRGEDGDQVWLQDFSEKTFEWVKKAGRDIKSYWNSVVGGAKTLWEKVTSGDWGFFRRWFDEAPLLPKLAGTGAALLTAGVVVVVGGAVVGGIAGGVKLIVAKLGLANSIALGTAMPVIMGTVLQGVEWAYNFDWAVSDKEIFKRCKEAAERIYEPLGEALGKSLATIVAGRFGESVPRVEVNLRLAAATVLINPSLQNRIVDALADLLQSVKQIAYEILFLQTYKGVRQVAAELSGNPEWGDEGQQPFVIARKVETFYEQVKASDYLSHLNEKQWEGIESFGSSFWEELKDLLTDEDTYVEWRAA